MVDTTKKIFKKKQSLLLKIIQRIVKNLSVSTSKQRQNKFDRTLAKRERDNKYYKKVFLSPSYCNSVCFGMGFYYSILVEIDEIFVE